ncbi:MAG TPA: hypothetical protein VJ739_07150, partial [Gemmataceae bacterium]|nr:hypothetical protein [Gemmataceae bacterium]
LSLDEAAAQFQELDSLSGTFNWDAFRRATPGSSDEERQRRAVIAHVESQLVNDRAESQAVVPRLEAELQAFLGKNASGRPEGASARGRAEPTH